MRTEHNLRNRVVGVVMGLLATLTAGQVAAAPVFTVYTDESAWQAALSGAYSTENFDDALLPPGVSFTFNGSNHDVGISGGVFNDIVTPDVGDTEWNFAFPILAWGGTWDLAPGGPGKGINVYADGFGVEIDPSITNTTTGTFWGFISDTPFTNVHLFADGQPSGVQETYTLENMVYADAAPVPEPATLLLVGSGMIGMALKRRRGNQ